MRSAPADGSESKADHGGVILVSRWVLIFAVASIIFLASMTALVYSRLNSQIGAQQSEMNRLKDLLGQYNVTTYPVGSNTCGPVPDSSVPAMNLSQMSNWMELTASLNATTIEGGQAVQVTVDATNTLPQPLKIFATQPFPAYGMDSDASGFPDFPIGVALYGGYFTCANVSSAQPLSIHLQRIYLSGSCPITECPSLRYVVIQPESENASATSSPYWTVREMHLVVTISAYYTINMPNSTLPYPYPGPLTYPYNSYFQDGTPMLGTFQSLGPGTYTVAAGTRWGQLLLLHFVVQSGAQTETGPDGISTPLPQTFFGYDGSRGYTITLLDSPDVSWYQGATVDETVTDATVSIGVYINATDINSTLTFAFYSGASLVSDQTFFLGEYADPYRSPSQLSQYGAFGVLVSITLAAGSSVTMGIHADGPVYVFSSGAVQGPDAFAAAGNLGATLPGVRTDLGFVLVASGGR